MVCLAHGGGAIPQQQSDSVSGQEGGDRTGSKCGSPLYASGVGKVIANVEEDS